MELENVHIHGEIGEQGERRVYVNEILLTPWHSQKVWDLSPAFEWGLGARPALQLSLAICLEVFKDVPKAEQMSIPFKNQHVRNWHFGQPFRVSVNFREFIHTWGLKTEFQ
jgi:hypothetical protein